MARSRSGVGFDEAARRSGGAEGRESVTARAREGYLAAWRWRRAVEREVKEVGLTFTQWLVLDATQTLIHRSSDAVNQSEVAECVDLDRTTVSQVMTTLANLGHVDRGPSMAGLSYRIWVSASGKKALRLGKGRIDAAGAAWALDERRRASLPAERPRRNDVADDAPDDEDDDFVP